MRHRFAQIAIERHQRPGGAGVMQLCVHCRVASCHHGEQCGFDRSYGGVFPPGSEANVVPYTQAPNYPSGRTHEFEHPIAGAALRASHVPHNYRQEFTIQTPRETHRSAVSGAGGGITSTGSSTTARDYAQVMGNTLAVDPHAAVRDAAIEQVNAHFAAGTASQTSLNGIVQWVHGQSTDGRISAAQRDAITEHVASTHYQRLYGNRTG